MGVYFIAAGNSSRNRDKTLDRSHRVGDLVGHAPDHVADRLRREFADGEPVYLWGATDRKAAELSRVRPGEYVVDVENRVVRHVFRFAFSYRAPDHRLQNHVGWDAEKPLPERRPYSHVYFLRDRRRTSQSDKGWFRRAFALESRQWLVGQRYFGDRMVRAAMDRVGAGDVETLLGLAPAAPGRPPGPTPSPKATAEPPVSFTQSDPAAGDAEDGAAPTGQGYGLTGPERRAVERRAMDLAAAHYRGKGYEVEDVGATESYDLRCRRGMSELRVEVKGTTGDGASVVLTRNEVDHARGRYPHVALVVVSRIRLGARGTDAPTATGGEVRVLSPWDVDGDGAVLRPETYRYTLPPEG